MCVEFFDVVLIAAVFGVDAHVRIARAVKVERGERGVVPGILPPPGYPEVGAGRKGGRAAQHRKNGGKAEPRERRAACHPG